MTKRLYHILGIAVLVLLLASCSSTKSLKKSQSIEGMTETEYVESVISHAGGWDALTAKMALSIDWEGKGTTKVNGTLRIKKGEVIQLSIAPLLGIEVARAEISPDGVLVIDRMNKRYVEVSFAEVKALANADLDFHTLQALFLNELFLPGVKRVAKKDIHDFGFTRGESHAILTAEKGKRLSFSFLTALANGLLEESRIHVSAKQENDYQMNWNYRDYLTLDGKPFPSTMNLSWEGAEKPLKASFSFSRWDTKVEYTPLSVPKRYKEVEAMDILKHLLAL